MPRTVIDDLAAVTSMLRDFTGLQVDYHEPRTHISGPIHYILTFRTQLSDPGDNHTIVGRTRLFVSLAHNRLYQNTHGQFIHPELAQLVNATLSVYYDNLEDT